MASQPVARKLSLLLVRGAPKDRSGYGSTADAKRRHAAAAPTIGALGAATPSSARLFGEGGGGQPIAGRAYNEARHRKFACHENYRGVHRPVDISSAPHEGLSAHADSRPAASWLAVRYRARRVAMFGKSWRATSASAAWSVADSASFNGGRDGD